VSGDAPHTVVPYTQRLPSVLPPDEEEVDVLPPGVVAGVVAGVVGVVCVVGVLPEEEEVLPPEEVEAGVVGGTVFPPDDEVEVDEEVLPEVEVEGFVFPHKVELAGTPVR